ncbi:bifunctional transcriptional activator/DNA repair enzyme AdaA [Acinetobacter larvae]|uniref:methylated-DNA--[protein]-cysteine S-methyltransferase n=1 Tax=Acinetobacter larvae TaxID=1789224 RepID=A0A1B2M239_9GAMM|nr:methylated-DNA--[protein]-cysteine S-methyltransferase [Acinetobacter larvae]AOA59266.1 cysteine methyltransferase [Acinetobacter larvae]
MSLSSRYQRIAAAICYIQQHYLEQPSLEQIAAHVHLSPPHLQRIFTDWAGISPKKFVQYLSLQHAKTLLQQAPNRSILSTSLATGLSSSSRLHDLFVQIEGMTPAEYKNGGQQLQIDYSVHDSIFGDLLLASTAKGICHMAFLDQPHVEKSHDQDAVASAILLQQFPQAQLRPCYSASQQPVVALFCQDRQLIQDHQQWAKIKLHLKASAFQIKVWESLLRIPMGQLCRYADIAQAIGQPKASRAVGHAIGQNPVAWLIPCHRVIQASGHFGQYRWGATRKQALIAWESAQALSSTQSTAALST